MRGGTTSPRLDSTTGGTTSPSAEPIAVLYYGWNHITLGRTHCRTDSGGTHHLASVRNPSHRAAPIAPSVDGTTSSLIEACRNPSDVGLREGRNPSPLLTSFLRARSNLIPKIRKRAKSRSEDLARHVNQLRDELLDSLSVVTLESESSAARALILVALSLFPSRQQ